MQVLYPVPCPNKCIRVYAIERQNLEVHLKEECSLAIIECDFLYAGCEVRLPRKDMPDHYLKANSVAHLSLVAAHDQSQQALMLAKELRVTLEDSKRKIETLETDNRACKQENKALRQEIDDLKKNQDSLESMCFALRSHAHIAPMEFVMNSFSRFKEREETWYSKPFYWGIQNATWRDCE